ncbi:MAG: EAL domain-containing protein [Bacillota bacterium]|nr:EAL domain-containing protein [Bacillota bacterium]
MGISTLDKAHGWLRRCGFHVVFQPIVDLHGGGVYGYEALLRGPRRTAWESPGRLFATATALGLGRHLDCCALELALRSWHELEPAPPPGTRLFLNVRAGTLVHPGSLDLLRRHRRPGDRLVLELSEGESSPEVLGAFLRLRGANPGLEMAVDDFGTGYSNLLNVIRLRPAYIKLDGALTRLAAGESALEPMVERLVSFARELSGRLIAEGIEEREHLERMRALGVLYGQGWLLGRPCERPPGLEAARP